MLAGLIGLPSLTSIVLALIGAGMSPANQLVAHVVAAAFGLAHGAGFPGPWLEPQFPAGGLLLTLLAFNLGVEAVQLTGLALLGANQHSLRSVHFGSCRARWRNATYKTTNAQGSSSARVAVSIVQADAGFRAPERNSRSTRYNSGPNDPAIKVITTNGQALPPRSRASVTIQTHERIARMTRSAST